MTKMFERRRPATPEDIRGLWASFVAGVGGFHPDDERLLREVEISGVGTLVWAPVLFRMSS